MLAIMDMCGSDTSKIEAMLRRIEVTAMDKVLRDMINLRQKNNKKYYYVYMGTLDMMHDGLVTEALSVGISAEKIVHAIFSCEESLNWLREHLVYVDMDEALQGRVLSVLHLGVPVRHDLFAKALLSMDGDITFGLSQGHKELDLSQYDRVTELQIEEGGMVAYEHLGGVHRIEGKTTVCAVVPHHRGVKYYLQRQEQNFLLGLFLKGPVLHRAGRGVHRVQAMVDELLQLGCEDLLAWRLVTASVFSQPKPNADVCNKVVHSFRIISGFRSELQIVVLAHEKNHLDRKLIGTKSELFPKHCSGIHEIFSPEKRLCRVAMISAFKYTYGYSTKVYRMKFSLRPFTSSFLDLDPVETSLTLLSKLAEKARNGDVNNDNEKQSTCHFNARTFAVFGALDGNDVFGSAVSYRLERKYFYQDDDDTKSFYTPFSKMMIFATTCQNIELPDQAQHLQSENNCLKNWIALRAAFEFDIKKGKFRFGTKEFRRANELASKSLSEFIKDTPRRFTEVFDASPAKVTVSSLTTLTEQIAERTGASSAWLLREMVSMYIAKGARVESTGPVQNDSYGRMEMAVHQGNCSNAQTKVHVFDCKVDIEGVLCGVDERGKIWMPLCHPKNNIRVELRGNDQQGVSDPEAAMTWLQGKSCTSFDVTFDPDSDFGWKSNEFHVVGSNTFI